MSNEPIRGGCLCGAVRYELLQPPLATALCHCTHCQRQSGSLMSMVCMVPDAAFTSTSEMRMYLDKGDSGGKVERHFCGRCGSPIFSRVEATPGVVFVKAGTLDRWQDFKPSVEVYRSRTASWLPAIDGTHTYEGAA